MRITVKIRNFIFLWRENKKEIVNKDLNIESLVSFVQNAYKTKNSKVRNLTCSLIKKYRKEYPYRIQDYSKAKELYDSITPIDLSKIKKGSYVVKFSRDEPVKGKLWCEYYINQGGTEGIYKVNNWNESFKYWNTVDYSGADKNTFGNEVDEGSSRSFRFATKEEITEFKNRQKQYKQKKKEIALKQKELSKLYSEL